MTKPVDRHQTGMNKLMEYTLHTNDDISTHLRIVDELKDIAPDVGDMIIDFAYGEVYSREGLTNKQRALVTISSLITQGTEPQLELHLNTGLTAGLTPKEITESIIQLVPYTGFPKVLNALTVAKKVFAQRESENTGE
ncbi:carboxymuconolactone decarboxylase family protein [Bacillus sp. FJAT-42376]|uniref:carboxymuconolactone decarboxylase family protein n=1 Tax=Bacillus sp. FJAT-42376 TaxID=2014076 RepID=UPI000F4F7EC1|nr:carboxymuconolactone decarboxylase family protein [Bacillus sp. FJAT-42376]AZB41994.1 carboxymuconolactone decarboxylase family protein [Bacillus sp. FJAT-42376]